MLGNGLFATPEAKRADCECRGGAWYGVDAFGYCGPVTNPTGKKYSPEAKGCVSEMTPPTVSVDTSNWQSPTGEKSFEQYVVEYGPYALGLVLAAGLIWVLRRRR